MDKTIEPKISVIVPIYKVEQYLNKCVNSLVNQTYKNLEIILVDDESPDNCGKICDEWSKKDSRIKVVHKKNGGLSDARNAGLEIATGELISFIDSDDWISVYMFEALSNAMQQTGADLVECNYTKVYEGDAVSDKPVSESVTTVYKSEEALKYLIRESRFKHTAWNKLYKRELIGDLRFKVGKLHEDVFWTHQIIGKSKLVVKIEDELYYYVQRQGSIMGTSFGLRNLDSLEAHASLAEYVDKNYPNLSRIAWSGVFFSGLYLGQSALKTKDKKLINTAFGTIYDYMKCIKSDLFKNNKKNYVWYLLSKVSLKLCCKIRNIVKIGF